MALLHGPLAAIEGQRGHLFPFVPVGIGLGIAVWFALSDEPGWRGYATAAFGLLVLCLTIPRTDRLRPPLIFLACALTGVLACGLRAAMVQAPVLDDRFHGPVTGRVVEVDRSQSGALRVTLDRVWMEDVAPDRTPVRVRISLQDAAVIDEPVPGDHVMVTAYLDAPGGAVEPGGFDFRRMAFFQGLGAVGYTRTPLLYWQEAATGEAWVGRMRAQLSAGVRQSIPGDAGAFAAGVLTGDRSGLSVDAVEDLRDSSLAHLLAISGMNMAILVGFTFGMLRYGLALVPPAALRVDSKKIAAAVSLGVACFYLLLSGANVATERAFIMVAVMLVAVLLDRKAITLRSVAIAGAILLLWQPEALLSPGFQMSFAATVALIVAFAVTTDWMRRRGLPGWGRMAVTLVMASLVGGLATAPYAAAHFNRFTDYGLVANLLTGPVMGLIVMPAGAVAGVMAPFGLADLPLLIMGLGCRWILYVADRIAGLDGSVTAIPTPPEAVLPLLTAGLIWMVLWGGRARWAGFVPVGMALMLWVTVARPAVLIAEGGLVGVMGPEGRALSRDRGSGFTALNWLENDGDLAAQSTAAARAGFSDTEEGMVFRMGSRTGLLLRDGAPVPARCAGHSVVIVPDGAPARGADCLWLTDFTLQSTGTVALYPQGDGIRIEVTHAGFRIWDRPLRPVRLAQGQ